MPQPAEGGHSSSRKDAHGNCYCSDTCNGNTVAEQASAKFYNVYTVAGQCTDPDDTTGTCACSKSGSKSVIDDAFRIYTFSNSFCKSKIEYKNKLKVSSISAAQRKGTKELMRDIGRYLESDNE